MIFSEVKVAPATSLPVADVYIGSAGLHVALDSSSHAIYITSVPANVTHQENLPRHTPETISAGRKDDITKETR